MHETTPVEFAYAVDVDALKAPDISFWTAWSMHNHNIKNDVMGCGALRQLSASSGEIKSMRTHPKHLRKGVAAKLLEHIIAEARSREYNIVSLETGTGSEFHPAIHLYEKYGFKKGRAFADYSESPHNQFFHLAL